MSRKAVKALYSAIVAEEAAASVEGDYEAVANGVLDRLGALSNVLTPQLEAARRSGDKPLAQALSAVLRRINLLLIQVGQELIRFLDEAADVTAAEAKIVAINGRLDAESDGTAKTVEGLARTGAVLDDLAKLAGLLAKSAGNG